METFKSTREECETHAAEIIAQKLTELAAQKPYVVFGICGGRNVANIFAQLLKKDIPWSKVHIFLVDERCASIHSVDSNYKLAYTTFIKQLIEQKKLPADNVHPFIYDEKNTVSCVRKYGQQLENVGTFDLIILSSGEDGHVAALYPRHRSITNLTKGFFIMTDSPKPPAKRMTASCALLQTASHAVLLFLGKEKQTAYEKFMNSTLKVEDCPAKLVQHVPNTYILVSID